MVAFVDVTHWQKYPLLLETSSHDCITLISCFEGSQLCVVFPVAELMSMH